MIVASMIHAGLDTDFLRTQLATLNLPGLEIKVDSVQRAGIAATKFEPIAPHQHHHRNLSDIRQIITASAISQKAKQTALAIFERLANAEGAVHGKDPNEIHFHEVGAIDSIADIVAAAIGLDALGIEKVFCSTISLGGGTVKAAHGILPVPAPATAELLKNVPTKLGPIEKELTTHTTAPILTTITQNFCAPPAMNIDSIGYGAGTLDSDQFPNVTRLIIGQTCDGDTETTDSVALLETNIDDVTGEVIGSVTDQLLKNGALDVFTTAISMKQNRPAVKLSVISRPADIDKLEKIIFESSITFGIRRQILHRTKLAREFVTVETLFGQIKIKLGKLNGKIVNAKPEFKDLEQAAQKHNQNIKTVHQDAMQAYRQNSQP